jgi:transcriptional regulator with XRE-family HTH domain
MATEDLEMELGRRVRALRVARRLTQGELADRANVSVGALKHLEHGSGSTTSTLVKVLRALGEDAWISTLGPRPEPFNPLDVLAARQGRGTRTGRPSSVRHGRGDPRPDGRP